jgi:hypothetical protein
VGGRHRSRNIAGLGLRIGGELILVGWLYGSMLLAELQSEYIIMLLTSNFGLGALVDVAGGVKAFNSPRGNPRLGR